jgi:hypothetical protein
LVNRSLKRKAIGWFKHTGSWSIFQQMNWSALSNELIRYFINTSICNDSNRAHKVSMCWHCFISCKCPRGF